MPPSFLPRRTFLQTAVASAAALASAGAAEDLQPIRREVEKRHNENLQRLQAWIKQPTIAAEKKGIDEGCNYMMRLAREAGFEHVTKLPSDGVPGVLATLDAGAP